MGFRLIEPEGAECYFCDSPDTEPSREHIFARWLLDDLDAHDEVFVGEYSFGGTTHRRGSIPAANLVSSTGICTECNNGWMSEVESHFQPFLRARRREAEVEAVVRWFLKTAFVLNVSQNVRLLAPRAARLDLAQGKLPGEIGLYFHRARKTERKGRLDWAQMGSPIQPGALPAGSDKNAYAEAAARAWACSIRIDDIVGTVVANPPGELYRSSWEAIGTTAFESGLLASSVGWSHLPKVRVMGNALYLVPIEVAWGDAEEYRRTAPAFPAGLEGPREVEAFKARLASALADQATETTLERWGFDPSDRGPG